MIILFGSSPVAAQQNNIIEGIIYETDSDLPLAGAHILIEGSSFGTISGPDGSFRLLVSSLPTTLRVSHIGFEEKLFPVTDEIKEDLLMLGMKFRAELLEGITVSGDKVELIFKDESYSVLDFEFHENGLMLLIYRNQLKRAELVLLSYLNDTLASLKSLPGRADHLYRDCEQNIHYVARDSAYQIHLTELGLSLVHPVDIFTFSAIARSFSAFLEGNYFYGLKRFQEQAILYIRFDTAVQEYFPFKRIADSKMLRILKDNPMHAYLMDNLAKERDIQKDIDLLTMPAWASIEDQREALAASRNQSIEGHYLKTCVYYPVYAPLFVHGKEIVIFNHPASTIEFLSMEGTTLRTVTIEYHKHKNWERTILKDDILDKYYGVFSKESRLSLQRINIDDGSIGSENILYYPFVKKILVRNGYVYFTYRQPGSLDRTMLFRQKLKTENNRLVKSD